VVKISFLEYTYLVVTMGVMCVHPCHSGSVGDPASKKVTISEKVETIPAKPTGELTFGDLTPSTELTNRSKSISLESEKNKTHSHLIETSVHPILVSQIEDQQLLNLSDFVVLVCPICLEDLFDIQTTLKCKHSYHPQCIQEWALRMSEVGNPRCPYCGEGFEL